jgi:hypothetical protein
VRASGAGLASGATTMTAATTKAVTVSIVISLLVLCHVADHRVGKPTERLGLGRRSGTSTVPRRPSESVVANLATRAPTNLASCTSA